MKRQHDHGTPDRRGVSSSLSASCWRHSAGSIHAESVPNGIAFSEFKGYEAWQVIAPSQPDDDGGCGSSPAPGCIKAVLGNPVMIKAYSDGIPANGKAVPDGAAMAKVEWAKKHKPAPPYAVTVPGPLIEVSFMVKDSKRFPGTNGWGYATFRYDAASGKWKPFGDTPAFANTCPRMPHDCESPRLRLHQLRSKVR